MKKNMVIDLNNTVLLSANRAFSGIRYTVGEKSYRYFKGINCNNDFITHYFTILPIYNVKFNKFIVQASSI